jgi:DNA-binding response OmpR family regulator
VIVEDDANIALAQKLILEQEYDVHLAHDGEAGLEMIKILKPDLAVLDVMMPKMDGFEVCRAIRSDPDLKEIKVVMVTAKNQDVDEVKGMDLGADDYIMKPFEDIELLHVVRQVLR